MVRVKSQESRVKPHFVEDICTVFWRDWVVLKRRLTKFILSRMVAPILYLVAFGYGLGRSIPVEGGSYIDFLVPGILALNSMNISFNSITPVHAERIYHKSLEEYILAPIAHAAFVIGSNVAFAHLVSAYIDIGIAIWGVIAQSDRANDSNNIPSRLVDELSRLCRVGIYRGNEDQHLRRDGTSQHLHITANVIPLRYILQDFNLTGGRPLLH